MHRTCCRSLVGGFAGMAVAFALTLGAPTAVLAANGTWATAASGDYNTASNWVGGSIAGGATFTADFSTLDLNGDVSVTLNAPLTIGNLKFGDTDTALFGGSWELRTDAVATNILTLDNGAAKPEITVNPLVPFTTFDDAFIGHSLAGTNGFTKLGAGVLTLGPGTTNTITGGINVNAGTLRLNAAIPGQAVTITNGATLQIATGMDQGTNHSILVPVGQTANIRANASVDLGNFSANDATVNIHINNAGNTVTADGNWSVNGDAAAYNFSSTAGGFIRLRPNSGTPNFNTGNAFTNSAVHLDNVTMWTRTNSGGNDVNIGALSGTATGILGGGGQGGGTAARYFVGSLNTNTEFAGTIGSAATGIPTPIGGLNLIKQGTGVLTLSGTINNPPRADAGTGATTNAAVRGGVTQIQAGRLKLTNTATITGGINDAGAGVVLSTIDVQANGILDVTGFTGGTYETQDMQQVVGAGHVAGNWNHARGFIRPANTVPNFSANTTAVGGTIFFDHNLALSGGDIGYDATLNPATGNDLISVAGSTNITGGRIIPNFLAGLPPSTNVYTVLTAAGGITGSAASMVVDFPGRAPDATPSIVGNSLVFSPSAGGAALNLVWRGNNGATWDEEQTVNWVNGATPEEFYQFDNVTFDDTGAAAPGVTVVGVVRPGAITISGNTNYAFTGTGSITGPAGLTKTGAGNLSIQLGNSFTGAASVQGGTLDIAGSGSALGTGALTLNGVAVTANVGFNNSSLAVSNGVTVTMAGNADSGGAYGVPNLSGSGTLTFSTSVVNKWMTFSGNTFAGTVNLGTAGQAGTFTNVRLNSGNGGGNWAGSVFNIDGPTTISLRQSSATNVVVTMSIGEIHAANSGATLNAFIGGSPATHVNWQIGALNTNSTFSGNIVNGTGNNNTTSESHLTKVGTGELFLNGFTVAPGANNPYYTGDTAVFGGTLRVASTFFNDASIIRVNTGGILNLEHGAQDTVRALILNGVSVAPGTWGAAGSGATNISPLFAGAGTLNVTGRAIPGDFDGNGTVNGGDLTTFNAAFGTTSLGDADGDFDTDGSDFLIWQRNLGLTGSVEALAAVPEPTAGALAACCLLAGAARRRRRV
jgi:fibronectin-binding autotransporter adhesin